MNSDDKQSLNCLRAFFIFVPKEEEQEGEAEGEKEEEQETSAVKVTIRDQVTIVLVAGHN